MAPLLGKPLTEYIFIDAGGPGRGGPAGAATAADRDHPARGAHCRRGAHQAAGGLRHPARLGDGTQPRRVRGARGRGRAVVRGRAGGGQRPRPGDGQPAHRRQRRHGRRHGPARRDRADPRGQRTATWSRPTSTATIRPSSAAPPRPSSRQSRLSPRPGTPPSASRSATPSTPRSSRRPASRSGGRCARLSLSPPAPAGRRERGRRVLPVRRRRRGGTDAGHPRPPGRLAGAVRQGPADPV